MDDKPLMDERPLMDDKPLIDERPLMDDKPLIDERPLMDDRPFSVVAAGASVSLMPPPPVSSPGVPHPDAHRAPKLSIEITNFLSVGRIGSSSFGNARPTR